MKPTRRGFFATLAGGIAVAVGLRPAKAEVPVDEYLELCSKVISDEIGVPIRLGQSLPTGKWRRMHVGDVRNELIDKADYRHNPPGVPFNSHYHGNRWDAYNPPRVACPACGSEDTYVVTAPRKLDMLGPRWEFKCNPCVMTRGDGPARFVVPA